MFLGMGWKLGLLLIFPPLILFGFLFKSLRISVKNLGSELYHVQFFGIQRKFSAINAFSLI